MEQFNLFESESGVTAVYVESENDTYKGNPLIEALPPFLSLEQLKMILTDCELDLASEIIKSDQVRVQSVSQLKHNYFQFMHCHWALYEKIDLAIRNGYMTRNPSNPSVTERLQSRYELLQRGNIERESAISFNMKHSSSCTSVVGPAGTGKTTAAQKICSIYPKVIRHPEFNRTQVVHLYVDCPFNGSLKMLCLSILNALDKALNTNQYGYLRKKRTDTESLILEVSQAVDRYSIGVLVIDELQHMKVKSKDEELLQNFFVKLVNEAGVSIVLVGTTQVYQENLSVFRFARRMDGFGSVEWDPLLRHSGTPEEYMKFWHKFSENLWRQQVLRNADKELPSEVETLWFDLSQGIVDIAVCLFILCQMQAIRDRTERITPNLMRKVFERNFHATRPMLEALKNGDIDEVLTYKDLSLPCIEKFSVQISENKYSNIQQQVKQNKNEFLGNWQLIYQAMIADKFDSKIAIEVTRLLQDKHADESLLKLASLATNLAQKIALNNQEKVKKVKLVKPKDWDKLPLDDLRFRFSQKGEKSAYDMMKEKGYIS
jgi:signal recognition particle GTPase